MKCSRHGLPNSSRPESSAEAAGGTTAGKGGLDLTQHDSSLLPEESLKTCREGGRQGGERTFHLTG